jgi:hypothetical protein
MAFEPGMPSMEHTLSGILFARFALDRDDSALEDALFLVF